MFLQPFQTRQSERALAYSYVIIVTCFVISVLLLQFLFLCLYFTSRVLNSVLFLQFLLWYVNYRPNVFRKEFDCQ